jgi:hypothetical protein
MERRLLVLLAASKQWLFNAGGVPWTVGLVSSQARRRFYRTWKEHVQYMDKTWFPMHTKGMLSPTASLFKSVPERDYFHLFENGEPDAKKVVELLRFEKSDTARAADVPVSSVRYDSKMPKELEERIVEWATLINLVGSYFKDTEKTLLWFRVSNPMLGGVSPRDMIRMGRFKKLLKFVQVALQEGQSGGREAA